MTFVIIIVVVIILFIVFGKKNNTTSNSVDGNLRAEYPNFVMAVTGIEGLTVYLQSDSNNVLTYKMHSRNSQNQIIGEIFFSLHKTGTGHYLTSTFKGVNGKVANSEPEYFGNVQQGAGTYREATARLGAKATFKFYM